MTTPMRLLTGSGRVFSLTALAFLAACGSGSPSTSGTGGAGTSSGGSSATGGAASGGNSGSTGGSGSGGAATGGAASGGNSGSTGGSGSGGRSGTGGSDSGGSSGTGGRAGGGNGSGGRGSGGAGGMATTGTGGAGTAGMSGGTFTVTSPGWINNAACSANMSSSCATLPTEITRSGAGTSPELHWTGAPAGTKSFAVVLQDLSGGSTHWVIWNIPASVSSLPANVDRTMAMPATPAGSQQCGKGTDAATKFGYIGPGAPCNVYEFMVYALNVSPFAPTSTTDPAMVRTQLNGLPASSLLGTAVIRGRTNMTCN